MMRTTFLFSIPHFFSGWARVLDLGGVYDLYNESRNAEEADAQALYSDFRMVGQDLQHAIESFSEDHDDPERRPEQFRLAFAQDDGANA